MRSRHFWGVGVSVTAPTRFSTAKEIRGIGADSGHVRSAPAPENKGRPRLETFKFVILNSRNLF